MLCKKCHMLSQAGDVLRGHDDLTHMDVRFYKALALPLTNARTDEYKCVTCSTRWERDFDPSVRPSYSSFRITN
jgi:hypothetical protein